MNRLQKAPVVLKGEAAVWKYCEQFHKAVMQGAAVVAIANGIDTSIHGGNAVVAYSIDPMYRIGNTIDHDAERERHQRIKGVQTTEVPQDCPPASGSGPYGETFASQP